MSWEFRAQDCSDLEFPSIPRVFPPFPGWALTALDGGEFGGEGGGDAGVPQLHHGGPLLFQVPQHLAQPFLQDWQFPKNPKSPGRAGKRAPNPRKSRGKRASLGSGVMGLEVPSQLQNSRIYSLFTPDLRSLPAPRTPGFIPWFYVPSHLQNSWIYSTLSLFPLEFPPFSHGTPLEFWEAPCPQIRTGLGSDPSSPKPFQHSHSLNPSAPRAKNSQLNPNSQD